MAVGVVYAWVAPQLASELREERIDALSQRAADYTPRIQRVLAPVADARVIDRTIREASDLANARVTLFGVARGTQGAQVYPVSDSAVGARLGLRFPAAISAAASGQTATAIEETVTGPVGQAARPLTANDQVSHVVVFSQPLGDVGPNVTRIRRQIVIAGVIALLVALVVGAFVARALAARVKRLEHAAEQVAAGNFSEPIVVDSEDELGQLARAFNLMQQQLAELDGARKQFIATASHELRTPITSLGGFLELLQDEDLDEETRERFMAQLRMQVDRLQRLTQRLLDLSRLEAGALELRRERVDVAKLSEEVSNEFTPALAQHDSHLEVRIGQRPLRAVCDPERVAQVMRILIDNALTHTQPGSSIVVTAARGNGRVQLSVRDDGEGIGPVSLTRIFEPFATTDGVSGAGLGLAIARELADRMHGSLTAESEPGRTTFTLELPA